jgi:hypothetical protein
VHVTSWLFVDAHGAESPAASGFPHRNQRSLANTFPRRRLGCSQLSATQLVGCSVALAAFTSHCLKS